MRRSPDWPGDASSRGEFPMISRAARTPLSDWWWTIDRLMLAALGTLMIAGIVLSLAASPPVATRIGLDPFHFVNRHVMYLAPALAGADRDLVPRAASDPPGRHHRVRRQPCA